jgi:folate-binding protein YgfZ
MRRDIRPNSAAVFGKYIIFSKAELAPDRDDWQALAIWGDNAAAILAGLVPGIPAKQYDAATAEGLAVVQLDEDGTAFECYVEAATARQFRSAVEENAGVASENDWQAGQIQAGVARIESSTVEEFVPQIINYDLTGHVNFTKGCYTGQEVVARLHYRGTPKRRTYLASIAVEAPPAAGTPVFGEGGEQSIGTIVNSAQGPDGVIALVAATTGAAAGTLHVGSIDGPAFTVEAPPYSLEKKA